MRFEDRTFILVCEDLAHCSAGHFGIRFAELASGFMDIGYETHVLVAAGWAHEKDFGFSKDLIHYYGRLPRLLFRLSMSRRLTWLRGHHFLRELALVLAVRRVLAQKSYSKALIVSVAMGVDATLLCFLAGRYDWIVHHFDSEPRRMPKLFSRLARRAPSKRRAIRDSFFVALPNKQRLAAWNQLYPDQPAAILRLAGATCLPPIPDARAALGLPLNGRIALLFGASHDMKYPHVAIEAMRFRPEWLLYVVGEVAMRISSTFSTTDLPTNVVLIPFDVSNTNRHLWHHAADVSVLSFAPKYLRNSGTLMDALSACRPVVVSDQSFAAELVRDYSLGMIFTSGDPRSLADALAQVEPLSPEVYEAALAGLGNKRLAQDHLAVVGWPSVKNNSRPW